MCVFSCSQLRKLWFDDVHVHVCSDVPLFRGRYVDDLPALEGELYAGLVLSEHAHASIIVDASAALTMEGVVDYVCVDDVPGTNIIGT